MFFVNVMEGGDISIGKRCCEEGYSYEVPKSTAGFAFRGGLGDKQVNYDRNFRTRNDVLGIVTLCYHIHRRAREFIFF